MGNLVRPRVQSLINPYSAPNVEVVCLYSHGVDTPNSFIYKGTPTDWTKPTAVNVDGDGTVPGKSLEVCRSWAGKQKQDVQYTSYEGLDHTAMITTANVINDIINIIKLE